MLHRIKKVTDTIDKKRPKVVDRLIGSDEEKEKGPKPKIRSEMKFTATYYYFICDICGLEYGPKSSHLPQKDGGVKLMTGFYMHCPDCERFVCKPRCWNYYAGKCLSCIPSREIKKQRMIPKIRSEHKIPSWHYFFTCDICDKDYGPEKSRSQQADGGFNLTQKHYRQCPNCGRFICRNQCWNYEKGTCTLCNTLSPPEFIVKGEKLKNEYYLVCSVCRNQFGPISEVDWEKIKKIASGATKIALGFISSRPISAVEGAVGIAEDMRSGSYVRKKIGEVAFEAKTDLAQCPSCNRWVCIDNCWDKTTGVCNNCSKE